jgi:hypothetical protein
VQTDPYATIYQGSDVYYAWTAASGTIYDNDLHGSGDDYSSITVAATAAAGGMQCTMDTPANALTSTAAHTVAFGVTTTITCQVKNGDAATSGNVAKALQKVKYKNVRTFTTDSTGVQSGVIMTEEIIGSSDANGQIQFTITGPTDTAGEDVVTDVVTLTDLTVADINNAGVLTSVSGFMTTDGAAELTFSLAYTDTAAAAATSSLTANSTSGLASAVTGLTRTYTGTVYDQYGGTVSGNAATFSSSSTLPGGLACTAVTPAVCTTLAVHGLAVGDDVIFTDMGNGVLSTGIPSWVPPVLRLTTAIRSWQWRRRPQQRLVRRPLTARLRTRGLTSRERVVRTPSRSPRPRQRSRRRRSIVWLLRQTS